MEGLKKGIEERLEELNIQLPVQADIKMPFEPGVISGNTIFLSGQTPRVNGAQKYTGTVGADISIEEAQEAARICTLNLLAALKGIIGDLNKVKRIIKMDGYVAATSDFKEHPTVINAASDLLHDIFGKEKGHARKAVGMASLPGGAPVEIEMIVEI
ncbi:enamine deaminase RidA (YjgF/YER057c/UK114 family) [Cytobacillus oceanisediminis]|uniref:Enamine deaminase RidA (YjgF/YER057c/UK114 family) n=1 Tax=Cytobacillus oceanisediminis TaxID=665099 RepID=A0A2V2ZRS1_9BACI|nr:RidA family protein [Cytobacillus oceanisediminis]PWW27039.1 enamine deaminase RidA (YjgF/YER057c/UK114 family) [Cytobacillus oceanisediminis]